jgi:hypothetical protein
MFAAGRCEGNAACYSDGIPSFSTLPDAYDALGLRFNKAVASIIMSTMSPAEIVASFEQSKVSGAVIIVQLSCGQ